MIVVDVNVLAFYFIEGRRTAATNALRKTDNAWIVPTFWCVEFESILWKYVLFGGMPMGKALELLDQARDIFSPNEMTPRPDVVLRDALNWRISVYDAQYVSLAKQVGVACVTEDVSLQKACPGIALPMDEFIKRSSGGHVIREPRARYTARAKRKVKRAVIP